MHIHQKILYLHLKKQFEMNYKFERLIHNPSEFEQMFDYLTDRIGKVISLKILSEEIPKITAEGPFKQVYERTEVELLIEDCMGIQVSFLCTLAFNIANIYNFLKAHMVRIKEREVV